jgi:hypothetical protein
VLLGGLNVMTAEGSLKEYPHFTSVVDGSTYYCNTSVDRYVNECVSVVVNIPLVISL